MKRTPILLLIVCAGLCSCLSSCAVYDTAADLIGLPESRKPMAMRGPAVSDTNIYDVEIQDSTIDYLKNRRASR